RAGDWRAAVAALEKARALGQGGDGVTTFFLAMAYGRLGEKDKARRCYRQAVRRLEQNQGMPSRNKGQGEECGSLRAEAAALLGAAHPSGLAGDGPGRR